jgi:hypothetical protein
MVKSFQAPRVDPENQDLYTELEVLKSAAGYYVGTMYKNPKYGLEPGSRESGYFATHEEAEALLKRIEAGDETEVRWNP